MYVVGRPRFFYFFFIQGGGDQSSFFVQRKDHGRLSVESMHHCVLLIKQAVSRSVRDGF